AGAVAGRSPLRSVRRVRVEQVAAERALLDQRGALLRHALAVERSGREALGRESVVEQPEAVVGDGLALLVREKRPSPLYRVGGKRVPDDRREAGGHEGVEHDRTAPA